MGLNTRAKRPDLTDQDRLNVVESLLAGKSFAQTAEMLGLHRTQVEMIGCAHGHPEKRRMEWARDVLARNMAAKEPVRDFGQAIARPRPIAPSDLQPAAGRPVPIRSSASDLATLVETGRRSSTARTRKLADRLELAAVELQQVLSVERERESRVSAAQAEVDRLEAELARARAQLKTGPTRTPSSPARVGPDTDQRRAAMRDRVDYQDQLLVRLGVTAADVRAWADGLGMRVAAFGTIPRTVLDAYETAHTDG